MRGGPKVRATSIAVDPDDELAAEIPVRRAVERLREALVGRGFPVRMLRRFDADDPSSGRVLVAGRGSSVARAILSRAETTIPSRPEALGLVPGQLMGKQVLLACGADVRGLVYAVLEVADRVVHARDPIAAMRIDKPIVEEPANAVRSVARLFTSELYDKPWFHDEALWRRYLSELVAQRFNRFSLTLGLGYNLPRRVTDTYLYFAYPFLVPVPGHAVRVRGLPDEERDRNLEMLRFVSEEAAAVGLDFQLGLWTHAYEWVDSPDANYTIQGLRRNDHAAYCRDALRVLLEACPAIGGLTFRVHGESGIPERSWSFWKAVFDGVAASGRPVGIDLHAKGLDRETIEIALATGAPVTVSPKFGAEHMGLSYHQAAIREMERPHEVERRPATERGRFMAVSEGSRPFTRYGYGDFLREDRPYDVVFRIWPGTQRLLLWGDPAMAAGYGRASAIAGSQGLEWCEPLSFRGREGSGTPGSRDGYADPSLSAADDWEKYGYAYRLVGRLTFDPDATPETWRRYLRAKLGPAAGAAEAALANASRILPLVTTAHHPSASNNFFWPEVYTNMPIVSRGGRTRPHPYAFDTPSPARFGTVSPLDPEMFSSVEGFVREVLSGEHSGRYSPLDVAGWLEELSGQAADHLAEVESALEDPTDPEARRLLVDVSVQEALGRFFAGKLRAAVHYELFAGLGSPRSLRMALEAYRGARAAWAQAAHRARGIYVDDLTFGPQPHLRGSWADRLGAIDQDVEDMAALTPSLPSGTEAASDQGGLGLEAYPRRPDAEMRHVPPRSFRPGRDIPIAVEVSRGEEGKVAAARLRYRHMNQSERYVEVEMTREAERFVSTIPGGYTGSPYALTYFFALRGASGSAWLYPGLGFDLSSRPYFVLRATALRSKT